LNKKIETKFAKKEENEVMHCQMEKYNGY